MVKTVKVGSQPTGVAVTPNGNYVYATNYGSNTVSVIKTSNNTVVKTVKVGGKPISGHDQCQWERSLCRQLQLQHRERHKDLHQRRGEDGGGWPLSNRGRHHSRRKRRLCDQ